MRKPPQPSALGSAVAESLTAASARKQAADHGRAPAQPAETPSLLGAYREVLDHETQKAIVQPERRSWWHRLGRPLMDAGIVVTAAWLWFLPPAWLSPTPGPDVSWPTGPGGSELLLINAADAIVNFRVTRGRFPERLELDTVAPGVSFTPLPTGGFELLAGSGHHLVAPPPGGMNILSYELSDPPGRTAP